MRYTHRVMFAGGWGRGGEGVHGSPATVEKPSGTNLEPVLMCAQAPVLCVTFGVVLLSMMALYSLFIGVRINV